MEINEAGLIDILRDMSTVLELCVQDVDYLYSALPSEDRLREHYVQRELPPNGESRLGSIRVLRQRLESISRQIRERG